MAQIETSTTTTIKKRGRVSRTIGLLLYLYAFLEIISIIYSIAIRILNAIGNSFYFAIKFQLPAKSLIPFIIDYYPSVFWFGLAIIDIIILVLIGRWLREDKKEISITKKEINPQ